MSFVDLFCPCHILRYADTYLWWACPIALKLKGFMDSIGPACFFPREFYVLCLCVFCVVCDSYHFICVVKFGQQYLEPPLPSVCPAVE